MPFHIPPCSGSDIYYSHLTGEGPKPREVMLLVHGHTANWNLPLRNAGHKGLGHKLTTSLMSFVDPHKVYCNSEFHINIPTWILL